MRDFVLDLSDRDIFVDDSLLIDKKVSFLFGKNGTGKTTIASLFKDQTEDYDFRCFQGFDGIVGEDKKLNAVILGEENNEIDKEIQALEVEISNAEKEISDIEKEVLPPEDNADNLWKDVESKKGIYKDQESKIDTFCTRSARNIKNLNSPQVAVPSYNINNFKEEIVKARLLTDIEIEKYKKQINTDIKNALAINYQAINLSDLLGDTNSLLLKAVSETEIISEISGNNDKIKFAEDGLRLHEVNDKCAFCGNIVSKERFDKLNKYFSADEVKEFKTEIETHVSLLEKKIQEIEDIQLSSSDFYPEYFDEINRINSEFKVKQLDILRFLETLKECSDNKLKELFEESNVLELEIPESFEEEIIQFNEIVLKNNESDLRTKKDTAKDKLRFNEIKKLLDDFKYDNEKQKLTQLEADYNTKKAVLEEKKDQIGIIQARIEELRSKIVDLQLQTRNEEILAEDINKKLRLYVNFDLEYLSDSGEKGHYQIKCKNTGEYRDITQLSTGEKNIIAFLYFIEKLGEVDNPKSNFDKIILFDDPMNSNDDTMQYVIIEELNKLIKCLEAQDKILIMTHNNHFYLNVKYNYKYDKNIFLRLLSDGRKTTILRLTKPEEDFKTNYEALWKELEFLYKEAPSGAMLLNPIRRIIETYTKFNSINKNHMLSHVSGAAKLFNVNSHSIDDLEADLNGRSKKDIIKMMRECFEGENAINHFKQYWTEDLYSDES